MPAPTQAQPSPQPPCGATQAEAAHFLMRMVFAMFAEDVGLLTSAPEIGADLTDLFNSLTGYSRKESYRNLLVAPYGVRRGIIERTSWGTSTCRARKHGIRSVWVLHHQHRQPEPRRFKAGENLAHLIRKVRSTR